MRAGQLRRRCPDRPSPDRPVKSGDAIGCARPQRWHRHTTASNRPMFRIPAGATSRPTAPSALARCAASRSPARLDSIGPVPRRARAPAAPPRSPPVGGPRRPGSSRAGSRRRTAARKAWARSPSSPLLECGRGGSGELRFPGVAGRRALRRGSARGAQPRFAETLSLDITGPSRAISEASWTQPRPRIDRHHIGKGSQTPHVLWPPRGRVRRAIPT